MITKNTEIDGKLWLAGRGNRKARIMIVAPCVTPDEAATEQDIGFGKKMPKTPRMLDSEYGLYLQNVALKGGIKIEDCYYTTIIKYLPENKAHITKPSKTMLDAAWSYIEEEIEKIKPDIIVCAGKVAFDCFVDFKVKESDIYGAWFFNKKYNARLYMIPHLSNLMKQEKHERFVTDFQAIKKMLDALEGIVVDKLPINYSVIHNADELSAFVDKMEEECWPVFSVDCEWEGHQHVDGKLRSLQLAWTPTDAVYIRFMDDALNYAFDISYEEAGKILGRYLNRPYVKYIGHHISADLMWMSYWLKLDWYQKAMFDTEFAQQCVDESMDLGLDALALRYTDLGKYDWDLIWWRKNNPDKRGDGYGQVPDDILIPYAIKDVITVFRAWPILENKLKLQDLTKYYRDIHNPFVTDVFTFFGLKGLPIDRKKMDEMRDLYNWAKRELEIDFQSTMTKEAEDILCARLEELGLEGVYDRVYGQVSVGMVEEARNYLKQAVGVENWVNIEPVFEHYLVAPNFNIRSKPQMQRWLFEVKKYTPVKSTANKAAGMPSVDWEKIAKYPPEKQALFTPASDTQTLDILAAKYGDNTIRQLLQLNSVGNICKAFLRESDVDDEGNLVKENGLHYWLSSADAVHLNHSTTETGRPRSWNPNVLNWPSYINAKLGAGITSIIKNRAEKGQLPEKFAKYANIKAKEFPTIRSVCMARPGWCIVEADYQTAEMRGLAFIAEDRELMRMILEPDDCFAMVKPDCIPDGIDPEDCVVRIKFPDYVQYPNDKDKFLMTYSADNEIKATFTEDQLLRDSDGNIVHPRQDMHWQVCELSRHTCRETMNKKKDRGAAKVVNFCLAANTSVKVQTEEGEITNKFIQDVLITDRVFDGTQWVKHGGVVFTGNKLVINYFDIEATPDHIIWVRSKNKAVPMCFLDAIIAFEKPYGYDGFNFNTKLRIVSEHKHYYKPVDVNASMDTWHKYSDKAISVLQRRDEIQKMNHSLIMRHLNLRWIFSVKNRVYVQPTYTITDAGEHNRFTVVSAYCRPIVVANSSSYGGTATSIARKIEADTGVKPTEDEAQALLDAVEQRQPRATIFFKEMERAPIEQGFLRAASGRIRHCHVLANTGKYSKERESQLTALGRECRNYKMQESVGSSASRACVEMVKFFIKFSKSHGLQGYPFVCLYDSIVVHCPCNERSLWQKALDLYMNLSNGWKYGPNILRYPTDCELNAGWSTKPSGEFKDNLHDENWEPLPDNLKPVEALVDSMIAFYTEFPEQSVYNKE